MTRAKEIFEALWRWWRGDFGFRTLASAGFSLAATSVFALYNGYLGLAHRAVWNGSICVYYLFLTAIRGYLLWTEGRRAVLPPPLRRRIGRRAALASSAALLLLNLAIIAPITLMSRLERPVGMGLVAAIAMAVHATWKITLAIVNFRRRRMSRDLLVRQLRTLSLIDALVSVLTLQNTLIMVTSEDGGRSMLTLTAVSSGAIFLAMIVISLSNLFGLG